MNNGVSSCQAAIDHWRRIIDATNTDSRYNMGFVDGLEFCINHLTTMASTQPEIIRCKDCKFYTSMNRKTKSGICSLLMHQNFGDDWYCAGAERR